MKATIKSRNYWRYGREIINGAAMVALVTGLLLLSSAGQVSAQLLTVRWVNANVPNSAPPGTSCDAPGYLTIQKAIDAASPGDSIYVCPGAYKENVVIETDNLRVVSTDGAPVTKVKAAVNRSVFWILADGVTLGGFTIVPAGSGDPDIGVFGAWEGNSGNSIVDNIINGGRIGIVLHCTSFGNTVAHNKVTVPNVYDASGIAVDTCEAPPFPGSFANLVHHNIVCGGVFPQTISVGGSSDNNHVHHNTAQWIGVGGTGNNVHHNTAEAFVIGPGNSAFLNTIRDVCP